jgi:hypothetical protein
LERTELLKETAELLKDIRKVWWKLFWHGGCLLETALEIDDLIKRAEEFYRLCNEYQGDISDLERSYERLKKAWSEFLIKNKLGIIYI